MFKEMLNYHERHQSEEVVIETSESDVSSTSKEELCILYIH